MLGRSDLRVSAVGLGCNNFGRRLDLERTRAVVDSALDLGITFFDTADVYGERGASERFLGQILSGRRDQVVLATKFGNEMGELDPAPGRDHGSREYVHRALEASLDRLATDYVDVLYYHRPDGATPLDETLGALDELVRAGKVRAAGCSNFSAEQLVEAEAITSERGWSRVEALQNQYSLLERAPEDDVLPRCRELGVGFVPYFPLASGLLTGKYARGEPPPPGSRLEARPEALRDDAFDRLEALQRFATERGRSLLELAISGLLAQPGVASVIAGATSPEQVRANAAAADWELDESEICALAQVR